MIKNPIFTIIKKYDFILNYKSLYDLYLPIIGNKSINIYVALNNIFEKIKSTNISFFNINDEIKTLNINLNDFSECKKKLEAINLIKTYINQKDDKIWFEILEPLSFDKFVENQKYRQLLLKAIGTYNYEKLEYVYSNNHYPDSLVNISAPFESVFNDQDIKDIYRFNFENLYKNICKKTHINISLSNSSKQLIELFFNNYNLSINEIEHCIYNSFIHTTDNAYIVDEKMLNLNLQKYINQVNNINTFKQLKINRNSQIFFDELPLEEKEAIFNSYKSLNSEQYYSAIKKTPLTKEEKDVINKLRNDYLLNDSLINLMIDFSLNKTMGHFSKKYLLKMAQTANNLNLLNIGNLFHFITKKTMKKLKSSQPIKKSANLETNNLSNLDNSLFFEDDDGTHEWWEKNHSDMTPNDCIKMNKFPKWLLDYPEIAIEFIPSKDTPTINTTNANENIEQSSLIDFINN